METSESPLQSKGFWARLRSILGFNGRKNERDEATSVLSTLARAIEAKDQYTLGHADRVSQYAKDLGIALGVNGGDLDTLRKGAFLHDIGKISIPDAILQKPGKYTDEEYAVMKRHPQLGCEICQKLDSLRNALPLIRHHHERLDGSGYPDGIRGDQISPLIRVVTVVDIYDALRSQRSYKEAFSLEKSFKIMWEEADKGWWDKDILARWEKLVRSKNGNPSEAV